MMDNERNASYFFENFVEVLTVNRDEFLRIMKEHNPDIPDGEILKAKGYNYSHAGKTIILMRTDIFPSRFMPYLKIHELWEAYVARKDGYNLFKKSVREYKKDRGIGEFNQDSRAKFYADLMLYNYDFRHEFAIWKEYTQANNDGNLGEYHEWILDLRIKEIVQADVATRTMIENDSRIRNSIYDKITTGSKHYFTRIH